MLIDASDLTTAQVRSQYVTPLIHEILEKSDLINHAAILGIDGIGSDVVPPATDADAPSTSKQKDGVANDAAFGFTRCYAELIEEASALCAYMLPQEKTVVATVVTSCLLSFIIPQSHFQGFLRSYYDIASAETTPSATSSPVLLSLEERLVNATLSNHNDTSGGFPYSAARMRSLVVDDDELTSSSFLVQGLGSYLSSGMAFNSFSTKDSIETCNIEDDGDHGTSYNRVLFQAGVDLIQLLAMAICPNPPATSTPISLSMEADKGAGGELEADLSQLAHSTLPFSFQISYSDRLQLVLTCAEFAIPEIEDGTLDACFAAVLHQLQSSLFGFASYNAQSEKDAKVTYKSLANISMGKTPYIRFEFQRLLQACIESRSEYLTVAIGDYLADLTNRYNGSRYYADGAFVRFALGLLEKCISDRIQRGITDSKKSGHQLTNGREYKDLVEATGAKRQKTETNHSATSYHFVALLKATRPLFYFLLDSNGTSNKAKEMGMAEENGMGTEMGQVLATKTRLIRDVTLLLCYPSNLSVVKSAAQLLALALAYHGAYFTEKSNVKHLFRFTRQALDIASESADIVQAFRPLIITACRQSPTYAVSLLSYAVKTCSENKIMAWKIAALVSSACPSAAAKRLAELEGSAQISDKCCSDVLNDEIMAHLSCAMSSDTRASSEYIKHCVSLTEGVTDHWTMYKLVRCSFVTSNFGFAYHILNQQQLPQECAWQQNFLWLTVLSKVAHAEEILGGRGAVGIPDSLEVFNSGHSMLTSLAAIEQNSQSSYRMNHTFGFQLEFLHLRVEFLTLCMITRSLSSEIIVTGGNVSARSNLLRRNIPKCFGVLKTRYINIYQLYGLHFCQQTRSVLRTLIVMCQFMRDFVVVILSSKSNLKANNMRHGVVEQREMIEDCHPKGDTRFPICSLLTSLRVDLGNMEKSKHSDLLQTPEQFNILDAVIRCPLPFPACFFRVKSIPCSCVNLSASPGLLSKKQSAEDIGAELVDVTLGLPFELLLSGVVPDEFIRSANVDFSQVIAWKRIHYEGQLYEDDYAEDTRSANGNSEEMQLDLSMYNGDPCSTTLLPRGQFILPMICEPIVREGFYRVEVKLGCRDIRCGEWVIPTMNRLEVFLRVEEYQ
ncbi:hypothetical protein ACHAXR_006029 [Thalassiosira sp. AJA248-18]